MAAQFSRRTESLLEQADAICEHRGAKLTDSGAACSGSCLMPHRPLGLTRYWAATPDPPPGGSSNRLSCARFPA